MIQLITQKKTRYLDIEMESEEEILAAMQENTIALVRAMLMLELLRAQDAENQRISTLGPSSVASA